MTANRFAPKSNCKSQADGFFGFAKSIDDENNRVRKSVALGCIPVFIYEFKKSGSDFKTAEAQIIGELLAIALSRFATENNDPPALYGFLAVGTAARFVKAKFSKHYLCEYLQLLLSKMFQYVFPGHF